MRFTLFVFAVCAMVSSSVQGDIVLSDNFDDANGTLVDQKATDIGGSWSETGDSAVTNPPGIVDTNGTTLDNVAFADFTSGLGAGEELTLVFDSANTAGDFSAGFAGVSLFTGGIERFFVGNVFVSDFWGVGGPASGGAQSTTNSTEDSTATFTYAFDTGDWTFGVDTGGALSGTAAAGLAIDRIRFANGDGGDLAIDSLSVDISTVPEPSTAFLLLGGFGMALSFRRRQ